MSTANSEHRFIVLRQDLQAARALVRFCATAGSRFSAPSLVPCCCFIGGVFCKSKSYHAQKTLDLNFCKFCRYHALTLDNNFPRLKYPESAMARIRTWRLTLPNVSPIIGNEKFYIGNPSDKSGLGNQSAVRIVNWKYIVVTNGKFFPPHTFFNCMMVQGHECFWEQTSSTECFYTAHGFWICFFVFFRRSCNAALL